jgi:hypothetical protein
VVHHRRDKAAPLAANGADGQVLDRSADVDDIERDVGRQGAGPAPPVALQVGNDRNASAVAGEQAASGADAGGVVGRTRAGPQLIHGRPRRTAIE